MLRSKNIFLFYQEEKMKKFIIKEKIQNSSIYEELQKYFSHKIISQTKRL